MKNQTIGMFHNDYLYYEVTILNGKGAALYHNDQLIVHTETMRESNDIRLSDKHVVSNVNDHLESINRFLEEFVLSDLRVESYNPSGYWDYSFLPAENTVKEKEYLHMDNKVLPTLINTIEIKAFLDSQILPSSTLLKKILTYEAMEGLETEIDLFINELESYIKRRKEVHTMPLDMAQWLQKMINENPPSISYFYEGLLGELNFDVEIERINEVLFVKRSDIPFPFTDYYPIIEYADTKINSFFQEEKTQQVISEMEKWKLG